MELPQNEKELLDWFLREHVPKYVKFISNCWENETIQEHLTRNDYRDCIALLKKLREAKIEHEPLLYEDQIEIYLKDPWGD